MKYSCILLFALAAAALADQPAPGPWKVDVSAGILTTQASYSDNWTGGEAGSLNWNAFYNSTTKRQVTRDWFSQFDVKLSFGQTHVQDKDTKQWDPPSKSEDKIRCDGIVKLTKGWFADPYFALTVESQFLDASSPRNKRYVNPVEFTESSGLAKHILNVPGSRVLTTRLGLGLRQRLVRFDDPADSTKTASESTLDGGVEWVSDLVLGSSGSKYRFSSKLTLFQALFNSKSDELEQDYWKTADLNWDNLIRVKVSSLINVGLAWQLLYDKELDLGGRLKQTMSLGIVYNFANYEEAP